MTQYCRQKYKQSFNHSTLFECFYKLRGNTIIDFFPYFMYQSTASCFLSSISFLFMCTQYPFVDLARDREHLPLPIASACVYAHAQNQYRSRAWTALRDPVNKVNPINFSFAGVRLLIEGGFY